MGVPAPLSPTPASEAFPTILKTIADSHKKPGSSTLKGPDRFVYVCDCSDGEDGYSATRVPSLKRKATISTNNASGSSTRPHDVIEIQTDSDTDIVIRPLPKARFCKCAALQSLLDSRAEDLNPDTSVDMDAIPEIPRTSPPAPF